MPFDRHLTQAEIETIRKTAIALGLADSRDALLAGLPEVFRADLKRVSSPADQIQIDLHALNEVEILDGREPIVPLASWLSAAHQSKSFRREAKVFEEALGKIARNALARAADATAEAAQRAAEAAKAAYGEAPQSEDAFTPPDAGFVAPPAGRQKATGAVVQPPAPAPRQPISTTPFPATAVFISIAGLTKMSGPEVPDALAALHRVLRAPRALHRDIRVFSSVTGAIVLVPDTVNRYVHEADLLPAWLSAIDAAGLAVHAGVALGQAEWVEDADGTINATGRGINIAARLAASELNPGVLYHQSYVGPASGLVRRKHFLHPDNHQPISVKGKRDEVFVCLADPAFRTRASNEIDDGPDAPFENAVLLAYDLPGFSEGDLRTLASRFRGVSAEIHRLREQHTLPPGARVAFSPGGDGGVLAITGIPLERALTIATDLADKLTDADETRTKEASVRARIGVHYGPMQSYENAEGVSRPTGYALFEADAIAGDEEARSWDAIVVSGALIESPSGRWQEITAFWTPLRKQIRRFVAIGAKRVLPFVAAAAGAAPASPPPATGPIAVPAPPRNLVWPHKLKGLEHKELRDAILSALPNRQALADTLRTHLDINLDAIAGDGPHKNTIFTVVNDAEARGYIAKLFEAVFTDVPDNPDLIALAEKRRAP